MVRPTVFMSISPLDRISEMDEIELGGVDAPGFEEAVEFIERGVPFSVSAGPRP